jgi:hypothetical protein
MNQRTFEFCNVIRGNLAAGYGIVSPQGNGHFEFGYMLYVDAQLGAISVLDHTSQVDEEGISLNVNSLRWGDLENDSIRAWGLKDILNRKALEHLRRYEALDVGEYNPVLAAWQAGNELARHWVKRNRRLAGLPVRFDFTRANLFERRYKRLRGLPRVSLTFSVGDR